MVESDRKRVSDIQAYVEAGDAVSVGKALPEGLESPPRLYWDPPIEAIDNPHLAALHTYWSGIRPENELPRASQVDLLELQAETPYVMFLDVEDAGWDFRYRYYGTAIAERAASDLTGLSLWDIPRTEELRIFFFACYRAVLERRIPLMTWHVAPPTLSVASWDRLILPLVDEAGHEITRLLVGNIPGAWRRARD